MAPEHKYSINTQVLFQPLQRIDLEPIVAATADPWFNQDGKLIIELDGRGAVELGPMQGFTVPMGVQHRPIAPEKTIVLMIERADVKATGD